MLLSCCGFAAYRIFRGLTIPAKSSGKNFSELVRLMRDHQNLRRNPIAERFLFNSRNRKSHKNISNCMAELCCLLQYCEYGDSLEEIICVRIVSGVNHERMQQRL